MRVTVVDFLEFATVHVTQTHSAMQWFVHTGDTFKNNFNFTERDNKMHFDTDPMIKDIEDPASDDQINKEIQSQKDKEILEPTIQSSDEITNDFEPGSVE